MFSICNYVLHACAEGGALMLQSALIVSDIDVR